MGTVRGACLVVAPVMVSPKFGYSAKEAHLERAAAWCVDTALAKPSNQNVPEFVHDSGYKCELIISILLSRFRMDAPSGREHVLCPLHVHLLSVH